MTAKDVEPAGLKLDPIYDALWELCAALANEGPPKTPRAHTAWEVGRSACLERLKADEAEPVALAHVRLEDDGLYADLEVLDGTHLQPEHSPVKLYLRPGGSRP